MKILTRTQFTAERAWDSVPLLLGAEHAVRLHWTDRPYRWHVNRGDEVFVVLDGEVDMYVGDAGAERCHRLGVGDTALIRAGERHVAHPRGVARVLVVERLDSEREDAAGGAAVAALVG